MRLFKSEDEGLVLLSKRELEGIGKGEGSADVGAPEKLCSNCWDDGSKVDAGVRFCKATPAPDSEGILPLGQLRFKAWVRAKLL